MGEIIGSRIFGDKVIYHVLIDEKEALALEGRIKHIHMFTFEECDTNSKIMARGKDNSAKYFVMPIKYRSRPRKKLELISTQVLETETKAIFVYICEK